MPSSISDSRVLRLGAAAWILAVQFFVAQVAVAMAWTRPYNLASRYISDLGNTACGPYPENSATIVCSPWHAGMNASFILIGFTMAAGAWLTRAAFASGWRREVAVLLFTVAGIGVVFVGLFPENEYDAGHVAGAGMNFIAGNLALVLFGLAWRKRRGSALMGGFSAFAGLLGLLGTMLFVTDRTLGLGPGGMERVAAYPMPLWQMAAGLWLWRRRGDSG